MIRQGLITILLFVSLAAAESQEDLYFRAMKAEEAGDISLAIELFERALEEPGPYTAELQEIVGDYRAALEGDEDSTGSWEFHTSGNAVFSGMHYKRNGESTAEKGRELSTFISASMDYNSKNWIHSLEVNMSGDWFIDNGDMPSLDTSAWEASAGVSYSLIGNTLFLDVGVDMEVSEGWEWAPDFYVWAEKYVARADRHKLGVAYWTYGSYDGPASVALYGSWHRYAKYGWRSSVYLGGRFEADSIANPQYWLKWAGPALKPTFAYRFKTDISIEAKTNWFYGFVVDGPDSDYEKVQKISGSWGASVTWDPGALGLFVGVEQFYKYYVVPSGYTIGYSRHSLLSELKAGIKWNL